MRYTIVAAAGLVEPDFQGEWVKYTDYADVERARSSLAKEMESADTVRRKSEAELHERLAAKESVITRQDKALKAAKDRLSLLGHGQDCACRYSVERDGGVVTRACSCGLDSWMKEIGVG